jgi:hypothetical protein
MKKVLKLVAFVLVLMMSVAVHAEEPWVLYDNFNAIHINPDKWAGSEYQMGGKILREALREIKGGQLRLTALGYSDPTMDSGEMNAFNAMTFINSDKIHKIKATVRMNQVEFQECPASQPCIADTRLKARFFNAGLPVPDSEKDDVIAQILIRACSNKPDTLDIRANVKRCTNNDCTQADNLFNQVLQSINLKEKIHLGIVWDKDNHQIIFLHGTKQEAYSYEGIVSDENIGNTSKHFNSQVMLYNTDEHVRSMVYIDSLIENVYVNETALDTL